MTTRLSTHVLDLAAGRPAEGVAITLHRIVGDERLLIASARTNADGRTEAPLLDDGAAAAGRYELVFQVRGYFESRGVACPFLSEVPIRFDVAAGERYHVPLLITPWAYQTYRGS
jgi:5-hydroxyisourate hydrolase